MRLYLSKIKATTIMLMMSSEQEKHLLFLILLLFCLHRIIVDNRSTGEA